MNQRDLELLSSYLDGQLSPSDVSRLTARLKTDPELAAVLTDMRAARSLLRKLPQRRAPRNFTLTRKMVGLNPPLPKTYPFFRFASALAGLLFIFNYGFSSIGRLAASSPPMFAYGMGGGSDAAQAENMESSVAESSALAMEAPTLQNSAPAATEPPAELVTDPASIPPTATPQIENSARSIETPVQKVDDVTVADNQNQVQGKNPLALPLLQIVLAVISILGAFIMFIMRRRARSRWI